jgi:hypothetical protein
MEADEWQGLMRDLNCFAEPAGTVFQDMDGAPPPGFSLFSEEYAKQSDEDSERR